MGGFIHSVRENLRDVSPIFFVYGVVAILSSLLMLIVAPDPVWLFFTFAGVVWIVMAVLGDRLRRSDRIDDSY